MDWVLPTFHPAHLLRQNMRLRGVVLHDMTRAVRLSQGTWVPRWDEREFILRPSADQVVKTLRTMHGKRVSYDVETDGRHPLWCDLRCIAFYDGDKAICVPLLYRDGTMREVPDGKRTKRVPVWKPYFRGKPYEKVLGAMRKLAESSGTKFETQNGQYDRMVVKSQLGIEFPAALLPSFDTILGHHVVASYLPHRLGFLASLYTEVPYYKATDEGASWSSGSDLELWLYCCRDVKATYFAATKMRVELETRPENHAIYQHDAWQEYECQLWKERGILVDLDALAYFRHHYRAVSAKALAAMKGVVRRLMGRDAGPLGDDVLNELLDKWKAKAVKADDELLLSEEFEQDPDSAVDYFNPASLVQLRTLLNKLGIPLKERTATGELSTAKEFLLQARKELLTLGVPSDDDRLAFLDYLFAWREAEKVDSTYLYPEVLQDGRVHPTFNVHVVPTGRLSSSGPNFQNQPQEIRGMFVPAPGHVFVAGDWDALEMRLNAYLSGDPEYIAVFEAYDAGTGPKPHIVNASTLFGLPCTKELPDRFPGMYRAAKVFAYLLAYGGGEATLYDKMREEMPDLNLETMRACVARYKEKFKRLFRFMKEVVHQGSTQGFLDSPIRKRRVHYFERVFGEDSPEATAMQNMPLQSGGADIVSERNKELNAKIPDVFDARLAELATNWPYAGSPHIWQLAQVHDELLYEVPEVLAEDFKKLFKKLAEVPPREYAERKLPVDVKIHKRWKPVQARCLKVNEGKACRELTSIEPESKTEEAITWAGECPKCKSRVEVVVPVEDAFTVGG